MAESFVDQSIDGLCAELCATLGSETYLVNPSAAVVHALVDWGVDHPDSFSPMRLLGDEATLKQALDQFIVATRAADLVESGLLELRAHPTPPKSSVAVDGQRLLVIVDADECVGAIASDERRFVEELHATCSKRFDTAEVFPLRTPALSRIEETLADRLGEDRWQDFLALTDQAAATGVVDEVIISLLVAAKHRDLLYNVSKWGEDVGLASKATFSRKKSDLEEVGLIETDSEPIDVGRPRLRLRVAEPALDSATAAELIEETEHRLA